MTWVAVALAGALGAVARVLVDAAVRRRPARGTLLTGAVAVNVVGSSAAGVVAALATAALLHDVAVTVVAGGFLGAFTTFSTAMVEVVELLHRGARLGASLRAAVPVVLAVGAAGVGYALVLALVG